MVINIFFIKLKYTKKIVFSFLVFFLYIANVNAELKIDITSGYTEPTPIGISDFIILGDQNKQITKSDEKILCDACEAVIGAIFIDRGFNYVKEFVLRIWKKQIGQSYVTVLDSKTKLQEHSLKLYKKLPIYKFIGSKGPRHNPIFKISVSIYGSKNFLGIGNSKKEAEQNAANNLLKNINII